MESLIVISIFIVITLFVVGAIVIAIQMEKKRREKLATAAEELGLAFFPEGSDALYNRLSKFSLFNLGRDRKMKNLVQGDAGDVKLAIFDYQYTTGSGKNTHTHKTTVAVIESQAIRCPVFSLRPENWLFDRVGGMLGFQDIDFESHPKFSSMFVLKSPDEQGVRAFFKPALLEYFEAQPNLSVEAERGVMFFYRGTKLNRPEDLKDLFAKAYEVYGRMVDA
jgi:hypothetical protein